MENMVRTNKLAIRQPVVSKPRIKKTDRLRNLEPTRKLSYERSQDISSLNEFNDEQPLKKLTSLSSLDELKPLNNK